MDHIQCGRQCGMDLRTELSNHHMDTGHRQSPRILHTVIRMELDHIHQTEASTDKNHNIQSFTNRCVLNHISYKYDQCLVITNYR